MKIVLSDCLKRYDDYAVKFVKALKQFQTPDAEQVQAIVNDALNQATELEIEHVCQLNCTALLIVFQLRFVC